MSLTVLVRLIDEPSPPRPDKDPKKVHNLRPVRENMQKKEKSSNFSPFLSERVLLALVHTLVSILITQLVF